nr:preprotein translocase subunit SecY [Naumannella cuiyingiana]
MRIKILFTLGIVAIFRLGSVIPVPNVNIQRLNECRQLGMTGGIGGEGSQQIYSLINLFSGGALLQLAVFALGIMPYITASIILQLMTVVIPKLDEIKKEGAAGQTKITQYTRYLTIVLAILNSTAFVSLAVSGGLFPGCDGLVYETSLFPIIVMVMTMTAGTGLVMWLGELITEKGIGNGMSILIFTQVAATFPSALWAIKEAQPGQAGWVTLVLVVAIGLLVMSAVVYIELAQRRIPVHYAKRMVGTRMFGGTSTYIPIKVNQAGVIPVIFASSLLYIPVLYSQFDPTGPVSSWVQNNLVQGNHPIYMAVFFVLIIAFAYFYVSITFNPEEVADNMKKYGGFIPGIRAGAPTARYLGYVLSRLTAPGSLYLAVIALLPTFAFAFLPGANQNFPFGGTSLLIIVGVGIDTVKQIESRLQQRNYEGFLR